MNIYISADIEGISGVVNGTHTTQSSFEYNRTRKLMTDEVNAAIRGAKAAGAKKIIVNDSHASMTNILIEDLDEDVMLITGNHKILSMMEGIEEGFDAVFFIGYHARQNTPGVLSHSYSGATISEIVINGNVVGEFELNSLVAGYYDVPVILVSGDDVLANQVKDFNKNIETVIVKEARSRYTAKCIQPQKVHGMLEKKAYEALSSKLQTISPCKIHGEIDIEIAFKNSGMAEATLYIPGTELIAPNRVKYKAKDILEAYKVRIALTTLASKA
ncbi:M55 family metallopeptidase [Wukongibacter baidiensis]|uniref:M55 family metallopeptidase n=1 Tax=Wukongibacter baidiensis TaxID=1723361 RepID=UPI003D7FA191